MLYMLEIYVLIAIPVFLVAGFVAFLWISWAAAQDYARAQLAIRRIAREPVAISRTISRDRAA
jgi:hypothetical protein